MLHLCMLTLAYPGIGEDRDHLRRGLGEVGSSAPNLPCGLARTQGAAVLAPLRMETKVSIVKGQEGFLFSVFTTTS